MTFNLLIFAAVMVLSSLPAWSQDATAVDKKIDRLEIELQALRARIYHLGPASALRDVKVVDPVFIGAGAAKTNSLEMANTTIN